MGCVGLDDERGHREAIMRVILIAAVLAFGLVGCATRQQAASTAVGAGVGGVVGGPVGAVVGAGTGAVVGAPGGVVDQVRRDRRGRPCGRGTGRRCR